MRWKIVNASHRRKSVCIHATTSELSCRQIIAQIFHVSLSILPSNVRLLANAGFRLACRLPLCRYAAWSSLAVSELQLSAATPLWLYHRAASLPSWIEFNCLRSAAVGKAARLSINWLDAACRLLIPLRQVALAQLYKSHHQSGNAASGKLVWNQHYSPCASQKHTLKYVHELTYWK